MTNYSRIAIFGTPKHTIPLEGVSFFVSGLYTNHTGYEKKRQYVSSGVMDYDGRGSQILKKKVPLLNLNGFKVRRNLMLSTTKFIKPIAFGN